MRVSSLRCAAACRGTRAPTTLRAITSEVRNQRPEVSDILLQDKKRFRLFNHAAQSLHIFWLMHDVDLHNFLTADF
jgi:hypothetical protein